MTKHKFLLPFMFLLCSIFAQAQTAATSAPVEMAEGMKSNGKIYVVVGVLVIILFGLLAYLISIDRKVSRMEKNMKEKK